VALGLLLIVNFVFPIQLNFFYLLFLSWIVITVLGSSLITWNYHVSSLHRNITIPKNNIAITFDDGPNPEFTPKVLSLLNKHNAKATFFCIGKNIEAHPELLQSIIAQGHTIGNHTYSHSNGFGFFSSEKVTKELQKTNELAEKITGLKLKLYRPAFGITNPNIKKAIQITKLISIGWSKRSLDTMALSEKIVLNRITKNLKKGDIILLHDSSAKSVAVLERLLLFLQSKEMQSVTVDHLLAIEPYA
jgi:peptidoglycan/xylan/chitin deacetylase (PgdA/CDA1 family)